MKTKKKNPRVAVLATDGFEQSELIEPAFSLQEAGAVVEVISPGEKTIRAWKDGEWAQSLKADLSLTEADPASYDALLLPGGVLNSDDLRTSKAAREFVRHFFFEDKPVFAICHGAQILIDAEMVEDRTMTSYRAISADFINAGASWKDAEVVEDGNLVTSRSPDDLPAFSAAICKALGLRAPLPI